MIIQATRCNLLETTGVVIISAIFMGMFGKAHGFVISGQNELMYGRTAKSNFGWVGELGFLENSLELYASFDNVRLHFRQRYLMPSEFGVRQDGLAAFDKLYVEYQAEDFRVRGGNFYEHWGRGLFLGSFEDTGLDFDNGLEGIYAEGDYKNFEVSAFRGVEVDTTNVIEENAAGALLSYRFPFGLKLGGSIVHFDAGFRHHAFDRRGLEAEMLFDMGSIYTVYATESQDPYVGKYYHSFYNAIELFGRDWAVVVDYMNYRLPPLLEPALQYPPPVFPQGLMFLFSRNQLATHYDSQVGYQVDFTYNWDDWIFTANLNHSSSMNQFSILPTLSLPKYRDKYRQQFWSTFFGAEYAPFVQDRFVIQGGYLEQTWFIQGYGGGALYEWRFGKDLSLTSEIQTLHMQNISLENFGMDGTYRENYLLISVAKAQTATLSGILVSSGEENALDAALAKGTLKELLGDGFFWPSVLFTANIRERNQLRLFYGYERGGLACTGGLCKWVNPFKGLRLTVSTQI